MSHAAIVRECTQRRCAHYALFNSQWSYLPLLRVDHACDAMSARARSRSKITPPWMGFTSADVIKHEHNIDFGSHELYAASFNDILAPALQVYARPNRYIASIPVPGEACHVASSLSGAGVASLDTPSIFDSSSTSATGLSMGGLVTSVSSFTFSVSTISTSSLPSPLDSF